MIRKVIPKYLLCILVSTFAFLQILDGQSTFMVLSFKGLSSSILNNVFIILVSLIFGYKYSSRKIKPVNVFVYWILAVITLMIVYLAYWIRYPQNMNVWQLLHIFFPVLTSSSTMLTGILCCVLVQLYLYDMQARLTAKQNTLLLILLILLGFIFSVGKYPFNKSIYGLYLILFFAWGMFLAKTRTSRKFRISLTISAIISLLVMILGVYGFYAIYWYQRLERGKVVDWNYQLLSNITSPLVFIVTITLFLISEKAIKKLSVNNLIIFIPVIIFAQAKNDTFFLVRSFLPDHLNFIFSIVILLILDYGITFFYRRFILNFRSVKKILSNNDDLLKFLSRFCHQLFNWIQKNKVALLTWVWLLILSFSSYLIVSDHLKISVLNNTSCNAITFLLAQETGTIVLTAIFLYVVFMLVYLIHTRYWFSIILVSLLTIFWSIANKIKLNIRGDAIFPDDLNEVINVKTLIPMIDQKMILASEIVILLVIILDVFLEIKHPIKLIVSWKKKLILGLLSILVLITPLHFNHKGTVIYYISRSFGNKSSFNNSKQDLQLHGPVLTFLDYIDQVHVMNEPKGYTKDRIDRINSRYRKVAQEINRQRKNKLNKQTIVFNLSESFVDPYTFPEMKFKPGFVNPIKYIQSLKYTSTYGTMLSDGYGGGTGDMEWASLTGLSMGIFKTPVIPFVQIVPKHQFYPTIGMDFNYSSAIHPFNGTYYSRIEDYQRFKFNKFIYNGSKYPVIDQHKIDKSPYNSDFTAYSNGLKQIKDYPQGQFMNIITIQNHMPYNNWYSKNNYANLFSSKLLDEADKQQMATYIKGLNYTDKAVKKFINQIDKINKPITFVFYGDHYPKIIAQNYVAKYPIKMHSTRYFIYANKYAREHGVKSKLTDRTSFVSASNFIAMTLAQTNSKVTPYQALLTRIWQELPTITVNYKGKKNPELINQSGRKVSSNKLNKKQRLLLRDYKLIQYDMTDGSAYSLRTEGFYK